MPQLTHANHDEWKDDMILIPSAMRACAIITGEDPKPQPHDFNHDDNDDVWKAKEAEAASMIRFSCSPEVWRIVRDIWNPHKMWKHLKRVWILPDRISAEKTIFSSSVLADLRRTKHFKHASPSWVTTAYSWTILTKQSPIEISAPKYSHRCHISMRQY